MSSNQPSFAKKFWPEVFIVIFSVCAGSLMAAYLYKQHLILVLTDEYAHLNFSKMLSQSMTPGISQIGFWPPLLHLLMAPLNLVPFLYRSGLSAAFVLIPIMALGAVFLYRISLLFTENKWLSLIAAITFIANPYVLYYASVPMMEVLFLTNLFGTAYFTALWLKYDKFKYLFWTALFVTLTCLSRYEGMILIPLLLLVIILNLIRRRSSVPKAQALIILFSFVAILGSVAIVVYSWIFGGNPLAFTGKNWISEPSFSFPTSHNILSSVYYLLYASYYMISQPLIVFAVLSLFVILLLANEKFEMFSVFAVMLSPTAFIVAALFTGSFQLAVPDLPPGNIFLNERYGLTWVGFVLIVPVIALGQLLLRSKTKTYLRYISSGTAVVAAGLVVFLSFSNFYDVALAQNYFAIRDNINSPRLQQDEVAIYLKQNYDYGKILITRNDNDPVLAQSSVPLSDFLYEGNYLYYDQSLKEPWLFARYVVMHNPDDQNPKSIEASDLISVAWGNSTEFNDYYQLVLQNSKRRVYKVRTDKVVALAKQQKLDLSQIPSINRDISWWDPSNIYAKIQDHTAVGLK